MKRFEIRSYRNQNVLFGGEFMSFKACLEQAVEDNIRLEYANFKNKNLANANLDDADLPYADFTNVNLSGANLSESMLVGSMFDGASLYNTCLAYSDLKNCSFDGSSFGATDIIGSDISFSCFSTLSCFSLDFVYTSSMKGCSFKNPCGLLSKMSRPPVVINGVSRKIIIIMDQHVKAGNNVTICPEICHEWIGALRAEKFSTGYLPMIEFFSSVLV